MSRASNSDYEEMFEELADAFYEEDLTEEQMDLLVDVVASPSLFIETCLNIQDKRGRLVPLHMNDPQKVLFDLYQREKQAGRPVRIIILKARQLGFSTATSALYFYEAATNENTNVMIIAHKADASTNIFNKQKLFFETMPQVLQPMRKASNAKEIIFENPSTNGTEKKDNPGLRSRIEIESAVNKDAGRSKTVHYLHMSELAFWPYPEETMLSSLQAVPKEPNTAVIIESTANGIGDTFYNEWRRAENGESEFIPLFFPWFAMEEYRMAVPDDFEPTEEEEELIERFSLDYAQIVWRRWCISANCGGDIDKFHQEYPATPEEAFLASGRPVFKSEPLEKAVRLAPKPEKVGRVVEIHQQIKFRTENHGYLKIWEEPLEGHTYFIGIDPASGKKDGDYSAASVFDQFTGEQVAAWHGRLEPFQFGEEMALLGHYYNTAWLIPEANNHGVSVLDALKRKKYPRIWRRRNSPEDRHETNQERYGWWTSEKSKKLLIDTFSKYLHANPNRIKDKDTLKECITYVYDDQGRSNAQHGCYDDRVIASALAVYLVHIKPTITIVQDRTTAAELYHSDSVTGY